MSDLNTVAFRTNIKTTFKGNVTAVFPYLQHSKESDYIEAYTREGQHHACSREWVLSNSRPSTEIEYADLKAELENIGYNLRVIKRFPNPYQGSTTTK
jgi:hypothetical protein